MASSAPPATGWAALPRDVLWSLFTDLGQREVLSGVGLACAPWWHLAHDEPALWHRIDLTTAAGDDTVPGWKAMALAAIDRSAGQCEVFWSRVDDEFLLYLADRASSMKSLRLTSSYDVSSKVFAELIKKFPLLEELELVLFKSDAYTTKSKQPSNNSWVDLFRSTCEACRHLHHFTVRRTDKARHYRSYYEREEERSLKRFSIPKMHGLHSLELSGGHLTKHLVINIVDNCPSLESLNISDMYLDTEEGKDLRNKCSQIKNLRLPEVYYVENLMVS
ncbi:unnamed protein product [Urochloa decumbens]|uniref:F-box domain-containing protein n=1 Tax=Urochloa decumbens TaxID=240449 RepID=A0ABC8VZ69_9POAL